MTKSRLKRLAVYLVGLLILIELAMQIAAYMIWSQRRSGETRTEGDGPVVLCCGDSMSYGLGATEPTKSYPAQLEALLRERDGREWVVVNGAWPGRNSRQLLGYLPDQIRRFAPDYICVLVGTNDQWSQPGAAGKAMRAHEEQESFPIVWRTGQLFDILRVGRLAEHGTEEFVGQWNKDGVLLHFQPNGRLVWDANEVRWLTRDGKLFVVMPDQREIEVRWRVRDGNLELESEVWGDEVQVLEPGVPKDLTPLQLAQRAADAGDWADAQSAFERALTDATTDAARATALEGIVTASIAQSKPAAAEAPIERLIALANAQRGRGTLEQPVGESVAIALATAGRIEDAVGSARKLVHDFPESQRAWEVLLKHGLEHGHDDTVIEALGIAIDRLPKDRPWRGHLLVQRGLLLRKDDPAAFLEGLFAGLLTTTDEDHVINHIRIARDSLSDEVCEQAILRVGATGDQRTRLRDVFERGMSAEGTGQALIENLRAVTGVAREAGARLLLLDYPFRDLEHERLVDMVAEQNGIERVHLRPRFDRALTTRARDELFIRDDVHCTDAGYAIMAAAVADKLLEIAR